ETTFRGGPSAAARLALRRAETYLQLTKLLLESGEARPARKDAGASGTGSREAQLRSLQQRFALSCRNADALLRPPQNEELRAHLESLRSENRQLTDGPGSSRLLATLRREAEQFAQRGDVTDGGKPADDTAPAGWDVASLTGSGRPLHVSLSGARTPRGA